MNDVMRYISQKRYLPFLRGDNATTIVLFYRGIDDSSEFLLLVIQLRSNYV